MANALATLGVGLSMFIWPPLIRFLIDEYTWQGAYLVHAALVLNCVPLAMTYVPFKAKDKIRPKKMHYCQESNKSKRSCRNQDLLSILKNPVTFPYLFGSNLIVLSYILNISFIPATAMSRGVDKYSAAFLVSIFGIGNCLGRIFIAVIGDHRKINLLCVCSLAETTMGVLTGLIPLILSFGYVMLAVTVAFTGMCMGKKNMGLF